MPTISWLDKSALVATSATWAQCQHGRKAWLAVRLTHPTTLTQPVIHDKIGTHFGQETIPVSSQHEILQNA